jgi:hypothetical protein
LGEIDIYYYSPSYNLTCSEVPAALGMTLVLWSLQIGLSLNILFSWKVLPQQAAFLDKHWHP